MLKYDFYTMIGRREEKSRSKVHIFKVNQNTVFPKTQNNPPQNHTYTQNKLKTTPKKQTPASGVSFFLFSKKNVILVYRTGIKVNF